MFMTGKPRKGANLGTTRSSRVGRAGAEPAVTPGDGPLHADVGANQLADLVKGVEAINRSIQDRSALEAQLGKAIDEVVALRDLRVQLIEMQAALATAEQRQVQSDEARQWAERATRDISSSMAASSERLEAVENELKTVKKKYRRAASNAEQAKRELTSMERQVRALESEITLLNQSLPVRIAKGLSGGGWIGRLGSRRSRKVLHAQHVELLTGSGLFDADWYLAAYPDVAEAGSNPADHYLSDGWREGRNPGPDFSSNGYLKANRDVATAGLNPLIHYLEHGISEGRLPGDPGPAIIRRSTEDFGPPFSVPSFEIDPAPVVRWVRHYELDAGPCLTVGTHLAGYLSDDQVAGLDQTLSRFWRLSALPQGRSGMPPSDGQPSGAPVLSLSDSWVIGGTLLRTRWLNHQGEPMVVRGYQRAGRLESVRLVGEGLVSAALDPADFSLTNPLMPILFVASRPTGEVIGSIVLAFPSLSRGGLHYAELLAQPADDRVDLAALGDRLAEALESILDGHVPPLVRSIQVNLAGADGSQPMFQSDLQDWIELVMRASIDEPDPSPDHDSASARFLVDRASGTPAPRSERSDGRGRLILPADTIPTIAVLVSAASKDAPEAKAGATTASLLVAGADSTMAALAVEIPNGPTMPSPAVSGRFALAFPLLDGAITARPDLHCAIRIPIGRRLTESELLQPVAQPYDLAPPGTQRPIIVAIEPGLWTQPALEAGLGALSLQRGNESLRIYLIGPSTPGQRSLARELFHDRVETRPNVHSFVDSLGDDDVMHLGPQVILHDDRTLDTFRSMLSQDGIASASCPIIACSKRGKSWDVKVAGAGSAVTGDENGGLLDLGGHFETFWRKAVPIKVPPGDLWVTRSDVLRNGPEEAAGAHLYTGMLTASYFDEAPDHLATLHLPPAGSTTSIRARVLVG